MFNTLCQLLTQCMSGSKRLTATVPSNVGEALDKAEEESFDSRTRAEREAVKRGLQDMGHLEAPEEPHQNYSGLLTGLASVWDSSACWRWGSVFWPASFVDRGLRHHTWWPATARR